MRLPAPVAALLRPKRFFAESEYGTSVGASLIAVTLVAVLLTASVAGIGWLFVSSVDGTVAVDNPDRPPEPFCQNPNFEMHEVDCEEPAEIQRDAGTLMWGSLTEYLPFVFAIPYVGWAVVGTLLYAAARLVGGVDSWGDTLAVWGWAMLADAVRALVTLAFFAWLIAGRTITADTEAELTAALEELVAAMPPVTVLALVVGLWQVAIVARGLSETQDVDPVGGAIASGLVIVPLSLLAAL